MNTLKEYIKIVLEANEYSWDTSSKKNMMLDKEGMEQEDKDNQEKYLKSMKLMENLLLEQEVKFSGILKIMPSPENLALIESTIADLPPEAVPLPSDKFHVTLIHQNILKPYRKIIKQMDKDGILPAPPRVNLETNLSLREDGDKKSWVLWVENQDQLNYYVDEIMELIGGATNPEPERVFHISVANLTGSPGDSVR